MEEYIFVLLYAVTLLLLSCFIPLRPRLSVLLISFPLACLGLLRYNVGADYPVYLERYRAGLSLSTASSFEALNNIYEYFMRFLAFDSIGAGPIIINFYILPTLFFVALSALQFFSRSFYNILFITLYYTFPFFFLLSFSTIRSSLSLALFMFAISCIYRSGNKLVFYLLVILGCFVHRSLAIVVPFAFITFSATNTVKLVKIVILISVLYALIGLLDHANILASLFSALSLSEIYSKADIFPWSVPFFYLSLCFSFVVVLVNLTNLTNAPLYISIFSLWPSIIMLFAVKLGLAISPVQRFSTYFAAAWIPFLIFTLDKFKGGFKFFMVTLLLLAASIYFIETLLDPSSGLAPYSYIPF